MTDFINSLLMQFIYVLLIQVTRPRWPVHCHKVNQVLFSNNDVGVILFIITAEMCVLNRFINVFLSCRPLQLKDFNQPFAFNAFKMPLITFLDTFLCSLIRHQDITVYKKLW